MKFSKTYTLGVGLLVCGMVLGYLVGHYATPARPDAQTTIRENSPEYKFINPILLAQNNSSVESDQYRTLKDSVSEYVAGLDRSSINDVSVYVRDMDSGAWTGVNETKTYAPGSMLKVAVMLGYLKKEEDTPGFLDQTYSYTPEVDDGQYFKPPSMLRSGKYTARDLIKNMIIESDNTATLILANQHSDVVEDVYKVLNLPSPVAGEDFMSPAQYATFWRILYNATYLSKPVSEEALELLSLTKFNEGLVAGLPQGVRVAHKFGEHTNVEPNVAPVHELHDCGIVYPANAKPYFVCVMTRGYDFNSLEKVISDISKLVYQNMVK